ncbi:hypothetical protein [Lewinella sp. W8]|uniref:hypothetical protein n=1 Tax=Lewinella sp. W8 TaxID=2528208 RepID=UPI0010686A93|nr:hypothetical protein [Lewinella sp. W8]MTB49677.1 hypothetical protein [Lewinella sp. W8]
MKLINQQFDDTIRQRMKALPPAELHPDGWDRLASAMDAPPENRFDEGLRNALTATPLAIPADWAAFEEKMDADTSGDHQLADALQSLAPAMVPGSWEILRDRMDSEAATAMDETVKENLSGNLTSNVSGWAALAARLELIAQRRGQIAAWKITELSLLLSALLLFTRFASLPHADPNINAFPFPGEGTPPLAALVVPPTPAEPAGEELALNPENNLPVREEAFARETRVSTLPTLPAERLTPAVPDLPGVSPERTQTAVSTLSPMEAVGVENLTAVPSPVLQLEPVKNGLPVRYALNAFVSPFDFNQVITPASSIREFDISGDNRLTAGYSAGLLIDISQGKNGLQTGLIYSRRSYIPTALKWYLEEDYPVIEPIRGYSRFVFDAITIPLNYRRTLTENDRWRFSGRLGMSMSIIAASSFNTPEGQERFVESFNSFADQDDLPQGSGRSLFNKAGGISSRRLTNPEPGWLQGGSILANSSFYLNGGVTVERLINERFSLYVSPSFGRVVYLRDSDGIGPYRDRIHTGSIRLGSRFLLSKK